MKTTETMPQIRNADVKGFKVVVLDTDKQRCASYEAKTEIDENLQRIDVYFVSSMREARDLIKSKRPTVAIFHDQVDGIDFVGLQLEFQNANKSTLLVPLVENPTLQQYRDSRSIGGVLDFAAPSSFDKYQNIRDLIIQSCRTISSKLPSLEDGLDFAQNIQRALLISNPDMAITKIQSGVICREMTGWYDLSADQTIKLILAEKIYLPSIDPDNYKMLLGADPFGLLEPLSETASWLRKNSTPTSASGLIITASNCISSWLEQGCSNEEVISRLNERPQFLKHLSIRTMSESKMTMLLSELKQLVSESAVG